MRSVELADMNVDHQRAKRVASDKQGAESHETSQPMPIAGQTKEQFVQQMVQKVKMWVDQKKTGVMEDDMRLLQLNTETMQAWNNGTDKTRATVMHLHNRMLWIDANEFVSLVLELSPHNYWGELDMDRAELDSWRDGTLVDPKMTTTLLQCCKQLCVKGILYDYVKQKLEVFRAAHPMSILEYLQVEQRTLDEWNSGATVSFAITNSLRLRLARAEIVVANQTQQQLAAHAPAQDTEMHV